MNIKPMEIYFLVRISAGTVFFFFLRLTIFHRSSQVIFSNKEAPKSGKIAHKHTNYLRSLRIAYFNSRGRDSQIIMIGMIVKIVEKHVSNMDVAPANFIRYNLPQSYIKADDGKLCIFLFKHRAQARSYL